MSRNDAKPNLRDLAAVRNAQKICEMLIKRQISFSVF